MDERDILERIVAEKGDCGWADYKVCAKCPMNSLKKRDSGGYLSCIESLNATELSPTEQNLAYESTAKRLLLDMSIEDLLRK